MAANGGVSLTYIVQPSPDGLAQAFILAEEFLAGAPSALVLGDNIFFGHGLVDLMRAADASPAPATVFAYQVADPERYGVVDFAADGRPRAIIEKPAVPPSNYAVTGLYFVDATAPDRARTLRPSPRGELEITTLLETYLAEGALDVQRMGRGYAWLDTGTHASLLDAGNFVRTISQRQGQQIGCPRKSAFGRAGSTARCWTAPRRATGKMNTGDIWNAFERFARRAERPPFREKSHQVRRVHWRHQTRGPFCPKPWRGSPAIYS